MISNGISTTNNVMTTTGGGPGSTTTSVGAARHSSSSGSGLSSYSPISTLERQWGTLTSSPSSSSSSSQPDHQPRLCLFVRANPSSYLPGGVEQLLKRSAATSSRSNGTVALDDEATAATASSSTTIASSSASNATASTMSQPSSTSDDPFSFLNDNTNGPPTAATTLQPQQPKSSSSGGGGFGKFLQKVAKSASHSLERGIHTLAIKADQGRNRDLLTVALYSSHGTLLSTTESQPLPEISTDDGSPGLQSIPFVIPLVLPTHPSQNEGDSFFIKLWIQSGASILQSTKSAKHYLLGAAYLRTSALTASLRTAPKSNWMIRLDVQLQSSIVECQNGTLTLCVTHDLKFPPLCRTGWTLSDPLAPHTPKTGVSPLMPLYHPLYNLPLDQSYSWWFNGAPSNSDSILIATERSIESTVVLPIATAVAKMSSIACQTSLQHAQQTLVQVRNRQLQSKASPEDPSPVGTIEGHYFECTIQIQSVHLTSNSTDKTVPAVSVSVAWQRPDSIFELDLLSSSSKSSPPSIPVITNTSTAHPPISSTSNVTVRFSPQPCPHNKVLPSLLQGVSPQQLQSRVCMGTVRLQLTSTAGRADTINTGTRSNTGAVVPQNPFDPISNVSLRDSLYNDTLVNPVEATVLGECYLALESFVGGTDPSSFRQCPVLDASGRTTIGSVSVSVTLQPRRGPMMQQPPQTNSTASSSIADGLVSIMGLPPLCPSIQPPIDYDLPTTWSDPNAQRQHWQLSTMGDFVSATYLQHHISTIRELEAQLLQERAQSYQQALSTSHSSSDSLGTALLPPHHDKSPRPFRPSSSRSTLLLSGIPFNVHTASLSVRTTPLPRPPPQQASIVNDEPPGEAFLNTTCGAPADHARDFGNVFTVVANKGSGDNPSNPSYNIPSPIGPVSGGLRRLESKRMELATCVNQLQSQLVEDVGQYFVTQRQAGRSVTHVPCTHTSSKTLKFKLIEAVQALHHVTWTCAVRRAAVFSQALGIAITTYLGSVSDASTNARSSSWPLVWAHHGYLISFEGLLSAAGKELGMIEDASVGIAMLRMVQVVFVRDDSPSQSSPLRIPIPSSPYLQWLDLRSSIGAPSGSCQFTLHIGITPSYYDQRIPEVLRNNVPVRLYPILFEVGVDIRQWGANAGSSVLTQFEEQRSLLFSGDKASNTEPTQGDQQSPQDIGGGLIDDEDDDIGVTDDDVLVQMNYEGFQLLNTYAYSTSPPAPSGQPQTQQQRIHPFLEKLHQHIVSSAGKMDHNILDEAATLARRLGGGGAVFCKSGKDRTAMHVTFKQAQFIGRYRENLRTGQANPIAASMDSPNSVPSSENTTLEVAKLLRIYGTRLPICEKNVGQAKYAFNSLQVKFMPEALKPPMNTLAGFLKGGKVFTGGIES